MVLYFDRRLRKFGYTCSYTYFTYTCYHEIENIGSQINKHDDGKYHSAIVIIQVTDSEYFFYTEGFYCSVLSIYQTSMHM